METLRTVAPWLLVVIAGAALTLWAAGGRPAEPLTFWTDYALAAQAVAFSVLLSRLSRLLASGLGYGWSGVFAAVGLAAALGGSSHALAPYVPTRGLWWSTLWALGAASFFLLAVTVVSRLEGRRRLLAWIVIGAELAAYVLWVLRDADFRVALVQYGGALGVLLALEAVSWARGEGAGSGWLVAAVLVSAAAAAVQRSPAALGPLDHNGLYHVVQFAGTWLLFEGARRRVVASRGGAR